MLALLVPHQATFAHFDRIQQRNEDQIRAWDAGVRH